MQAALVQTWSPPEPEVMEVAGRLDVVTAPVIEEDVMLCIQSGAREMILDFKRLEYISAAGLRMVLKLAKEMQDMGGHLAVCDLQPQVEEMFVTCGFDRIIPIYNSQKQAIEALAA